MTSERKWSITLVTLGYVVIQLKRLRSQQFSDACPPRDESVYIFEQ
jgi:hypothetical protein